MGNNFFYADANSSENISNFNAEEFCDMHSENQHRIMLEPSIRGNYKSFVCSNLDCSFKASANRKDKIWRISNRSKLLHEPKSDQDSVLQKRKMETESIQAAVSHSISPTKLSIKDSIHSPTLSIQDRARLLRLRGYLLLSIKKHVINDLLLTKVDPNERVTSGKNL